MADIAVQGKGRWTEGYWDVTLTRKLDTGHPLDRAGLAKLDSPKSEKSYWSFWRGAHRRVMTNQKESYARFQGQGSVSSVLMKFVYTVLT